MKKLAKILHRSNEREGFTLIEVLISIALVGVALIGLAQLFTMSVMNNLRANQLSTATFLCQQEIDYLRTLLPAELDALPAIQDEQLDLNNDGTMDFRRITTIQRSLNLYRVSVFPPSQFSTAVGTLIAQPLTHQVKAQMGAVIQR